MSATQPRTMDNMWLFEAADVENFIANLVICSIPVHPS